MIVSSRQGAILSLLTTLSRSRALTHSLYVITRHDLSETLSASRCMFASACY